MREREVNDKNHILSPAVGDRTTPKASRTERISKMRIAAKISISLFALAKTQRDFFFISGLWLKPFSVMFLVRQLMIFEK